LPSTARVGTAMERSHVPVHKGLLAIHLMTSSKKGISAHQLHRSLGVTYKTAWFMAHRIREAMIDTNAGPLGGTGKTVEADETYFGTQENPEPSRCRKGAPYLRHKPSIRKRAVLALVERKGTARTFHIEANVTVDEGYERVSREHAAQRRKQPLHPRWRGVWRPSDRAPFVGGVRSWRRAHEHG
jgi:hypothetical protein